jgi:Calpain family cysteine protease
MGGYNRAVENCKAKVDKIAKECRSSNQKYTDPAFNLWDYNYCLRPLSTYVPPPKRESEEPAENEPSPPKMTLFIDDKPPINLTSLIAPEAGDQENVVEESPGSVPQSVKRVRQIFDKPEFFVDGATADDVRQGLAGDCWFLSAISALCCMEPSELGNLVERVCVKRDEAAGVYGFVFFRDGEWRSEVVDDKLYLTAPDYKDMSYHSDMMYLLKYIKEKDRAEQYRKILQSNSDALFYAKSAHKNETWVPLIEKAFAKAHGDFISIESGLVG